MTLDGCDICGGAHTNDEHALMPFRCGRDHRWLDSCSDCVLNLEEFARHAIDALDHIQRVCQNARQSTRRIRWIIERAKSALARDDKWKDVEIPRHDPAIEKLENMIVAIYPIAKLELAARRELYEGDDAEIPDAAVRSEVAILARFVREAPHVSAAIRQAEGV